MCTDHVNQNLVKMPALTVAQLRAQLEALGADTTGSKKELSTRLAAITGGGVETSSKKRSRNDTQDDLDYEKMKPLSEPGGHMAAGVMSGDPAIFTPGTPVLLLHGRQLGTERAS